MNVESAVNVVSKLVRLGAFQQARSLLEQALAESADSDDLHRWMAVVLTHMADFDAAKPHARRAVEIDGSRVQNQLVLGHTFIKTGATDEARTCFERVVALDADSTEAHTALGTLALLRQDYAAAEGHWHDAMSRNPQGVEAAIGLASTWMQIGRANEAAELLRPLAETHPRDARVQRALALAGNYLHDVPADTLTAWHRRFGQSLVQAAGPQMWRAAMDATPGRKLRVGSLSPDFRDHSVASFILPVLQHHDRSRFEVVLYSTATQPDDVTARCKQIADRWRDVSQLGDRALVEAIRGDAIDILIELAGLFDGNRLGALARRAATVHVSYLGYPNTTGLGTIDYRIVDAVTDPPGSEHLVVERLARVEQCFLCYQPRHDVPLSRPTPAGQSQDGVRLGSFNNLAKVNPAVLDVWARVMRAVPRSRLLIKSAPLADGSVRRWLTGQFSDRGVDGGRLELIGHMATQQEHLATYERVDIGLDTFPYNGTTTTCEALWMGVPVVTLRGDRHAARVGASLLGAAGFDELIADSPDAYIAAVETLARDPQRLIDYRTSLRERMAASVLCDAAGFTLRFEAALDQIWSQTMAG